MGQNQVQGGRTLCGQVPTTGSLGKGITSPGTGEFPLEPKFCADDLAQRLFVDLTDVLGDECSVSTNEPGRGQPEAGVSLADASVVIDSEWVRNVDNVCEIIRSLWRVVDRYTQYEQGGLLSADLVKRGHLFSAWSTPGGPEVEHNGTAVQSKMLGEVERTSI